MLVKDRMTPNPITVSPDIPIAEALERMRQDKVHRYPVVNKKGRMVGIVSHTDLLYAAPSSVTSLNVWEVTYLLNQVKVKETMTKEVISVDESCPIEEAARLMRDHQIGGLPVLRDGDLVGIITESDLFKVFLELVMAQEGGIRLTVLAPYFKGSMAQISSVISERGGLIHSLNAFVADDPDQWGCILKVADITQDELVDAVRPHVVEILDVREIDDLTGDAC
jgi:acetoin utilization protein AcuB